MKHGINPALPYEPITIDGQVLKLCMNFRALAAAEDELVRRGHTVNLNENLLRPGLSSTMVLFAASLLAYQPDMGFEQAQDLVTPDNYINIMVALNVARTKAYEKVSKGKRNPPAPADQSGE